MRDFVQSVVQKLDVGVNNDRVSVVQYSREPEAQFYLNTYTTKEEVLDSIRGMRHRGGRPLNTGAALQYVKDNIFTPTAGSRRQEGIPQMLIVLSGGRSHDNVEAPATALKEDGVVILAIGNRNSSSDVQKISSEPSTAQTVTDFSELPKLRDSVDESLGRVVDGVTPISPTERGKSAAA